MKARRNQQHTQICIYIYIYMASIQIIPLCIYIYIFTFIYLFTSHRFPQHSTARTVGAPRASAAYAQSCTDKNKQGSFQKSTALIETPINSKALVTGHLQQDPRFIETANNEGKKHFRLSYYGAGLVGHLVLCQLPPLRKREDVLRKRMDGVLQAAVLKGTQVVREYLHTKLQDVQVGIPMGRHGCGATSSTFIAFGFVLTPTPQPLSQRALVSMVQLPGPLQHSPVHGKSSTSPPLLGRQRLHQVLFSAPSPKGGFAVTAAFHGIRRASKGQGKTGLGLEVGEALLMLVICCPFRVCKGWG